LRKLGIKLGTPENLKYENRLKEVAANKLNAKENLNNKRAIAYLEGIAGAIQHKANQIREEERQIKILSLLLVSQIRQC
jgi:hypothetical protein